jgi:hypothetical protein
VTVKYKRAEGSVGKEQLRSELGGMRYSQERVTSRHPHRQSTRMVQG